MNKDKYYNLKFWMRVSLYIALIQTVLFCTVLANGGAAQVKSLEETFVSLNVKDAGLADVFGKIESQTEYRFGFDQSVVANREGLTLKKRNASVKEVLMEVSKQAKVSFRRVNNDIDVKPMQEELPMAVSEELPDDINITGKITDEMGDPLPGASVLAKGSTNGTISDVDGNYTLTVPENAVLLISFIGYETVEINVSGRTTIDVSLRPDLLSLEEVVVVGYGAVKKTDVTGAVAQVELEQIKDIPANSVEGVLQGRAAGLQIISNSQEPGAGAIVRIRGGSSLAASSNPLLVVDGFPLGEAGDLRQINPADIASVEVLKDASASAIYGSRGANGVILITTKKAKAGQTTISMQQQVTVSEFTSELNLWRDPVLMMQLNNESRINGGFPPVFTGQEISGIYYPSVEEVADGSWPHFTNWDDIVFRDNPVSNNTTLRIASANERTNFSLSGNYYKDAGIQIEDDYSKLNYNFSIGHNVFDNLKVNFSNILTRGNRNNNGGLAYWRNPLIPVYNDDGSYHLTNNNDFSHPVAISENRLNTTKTLDVLSYINVEWQVIPALKLTTRLNYKYGESLTDEYQPKIYTQAGQFNNGAASIRNWQTNVIVSETFANFSKAFDRHVFGATAGYSYQNDIIRTSDLWAYDFVNESLRNEAINSGNPELNSITNTLTETALVSGIFRLNYAFDDKYLVTFTSRADGSSKFGDNNKWAYFPSGAISWKLHEEGFLKSSGMFSELKLRASYGVSGNQAISPYQTLSRYGISNYYNDGAWVTAIGPGREVGRAGQGGIEVLWGGIPNPDLKWETTTQSDIGIDVGILNGRVHLTADYYNKNTDDLLQERILAPSSSFDRMTINNGSVNNRGIELTLDAEVVSTADLQISSTLIYHRNRSEVTDLGIPEESGLSIDPNTGMYYRQFGNSVEMFRDYVNYLAIGQPINVFYGYKTDGIVQTLEEGALAGLEGLQAQPGEYKYVDLDGNDIIDENDRTIIGNPNPDFMASLNLSVNYKNFDLSVFFNGVFGNDVINTQAFNQPNNQPFRWTADNPVNDYPSLRDGRQTRFSDWWIEDGSFVRIQNLSIGYTLNLPKDIRARFFMNATNLHTFSKFNGYDPEVGTDGRYWGGYPRLRKWTMGLNVTF